MQSNKSLDGFAPEFYKHSLNGGSTNSELLPTQKLGVISLIFKKYR